MVRWIFKEYVPKRRGLSAIAVWLRDHGAAQFGLAGQKFRWSAQGIKVILRNRTYLDSAEKVPLSRSRKPL